MNHGTMPRLAVNIISIAVAMAYPIITSAEEADAAKVKELPEVIVKATSEQEAVTGSVKGYVAKRSATATKTDTPIIETPQSLSVVTRDEMDVRGVNSLKEALAYTTGVQVEQSSDTRDQFFKIRGFDGTANVYRDGLRNTSSTAGGYANADINPYGLERIEVLRGPASVMFGQSGPGGIVNLVTKRPTDKPLHEVGLTLGSFDNKQATFDFSDALNSEWNYRFTGLVGDSNTQTDFVKNDRIYIAPALTWHPSDDTSLTLLANYQRDYQGAAINSSLPRVGTLSHNPNGEISISRYPGEPDFDDFAKSQTSIGYLFDHRFNDTWSFRQNLRYSDIKTDYANAYGDSLGADLRTVTRSAYNPREDVKSFRLDNQVQAEWSQGQFDHTALMGLDYQKTRYGVKAGFGSAPSIDIYNPSYGAPVTTPADYENSMTKTSQVGLYLQDQIKYDKHWVLSLGGRWDNSKRDRHESINDIDADQSDSEFTGRTGLVYLFDNGLAPYANYSTSFEPITGADASGNLFKPTTGKQAEIGIRYQPIGSRSLFSAAIFDLKQQNVSTPDPNDPNFSVQTGEVRSRGLELEGKFAATPAINLITTYTYLNAEVSKSNDATVKGNQRALVPKHAASAWADYTVQTGNLQGLVMGLGARYNGEMAITDANIYKIPSRTLWDASLRYAWGAYTASLNATNLLDKEYVGACFSEDYGFCAYGPRRNVIASLLYRW